MPRNPRGVFQIRTKHYKYCSWSWTTLESHKYQPFFGLCNFSQQLVISCARIDFLFNLRLKNNHQKHLFCWSENSSTLNTNWDSHCFFLPYCCFSTSVNTWKITPTYGTSKFVKAYCRNISTTLKNESVAGLLPTSTLRGDTVSCNENVLSSYVHQSFESLVPCERASQISWLCVWDNLWFGRCYTSMECNVFFYCLSSLFLLLKHRAGVAH